MLHIVKKGKHLVSDKVGAVLSQTTYLVSDARDFPPSVGEVSTHPRGGEVQQDHSVAAGEHGFCEMVCLLVQRVVSMGFYP